MSILVIMDIVALREFHIPVELRQIIRLFLARKLSNDSIHKSVEGMHLEKTKLVESVNENQTLPFDKWISKLFYCTIS